MLRLLGVSTPVSRQWVHLNGHARAVTSTRVAVERTTLIEANNPQSIKSVRGLAAVQHEKETFCREVVGVAFVHGNVIIPPC